MAEESLLRVRVYFYGNVQGVGFRYTAYRIAAKFKVFGYVKNLQDGRVELVAEGEHSEVEQFLKRLSDTMRSYILKEERFEEPYLGEFDGFEIAY